MSTKYIVNNLSGQTINGNPIDPKYKVFTALLTQGGFDALQIIINLPLTIGVTYRIASTDGDTVDFTNVGAPNNNLDTYFIATGTTPNSWGTGQNGEVEYNTATPVAKVLENTIGNVWFDYQQFGIYGLNSEGLFTLEKTAIFFGPPYSDENLQTVINVETFNATDSNYLFKVYHENFISDSYLINNPIEIRVYN